MRVPATLRSFPGPIELIHAQAGPPLLRLARLGIFLLWIVKLLLDPLWRLGQLPPELVQPTGLLALIPPDVFPFFWSSTGLTILWVLTLVALLAGLTNRAFPAVATVAAFLLTLYASVIRSFGPAVHTDIVLLLGTYALALFAWADVAAKRSGRAMDSSAPLLAIVALLTVTYSLVGLNRAIADFPVFTGHSMEIWTIDASLRGYYFNTEVGWHLPEWPLVVFFLRGGLPVITFFEITAPLCLALPRYRWIFIPFMLSFHLLSLVFMNIFFFDDMLLYLLLVDWSRKFPALRSKP